MVGFVYINFAVKIFSALSMLLLKVLFSLIKKVIFFNMIKICIEGKNFEFYLKKGEIIPAGGYSFEIYVASNFFKKMWRETLIF